MWQVCTNDRELPLKLALCRPQEFALEARLLSARSLSKRHSPELPLICCLSVGSNEQEIEYC